TVMRDEGNTKAHWILHSLIRDASSDAAVREIETELQISVSRPWKDAEDVREVVADTARGLVEPGCFEACALELALAAADVFVAARKADSVGMVLDLVVGAGPRGEAMLERFRDALKELQAGKVRLASAARPFREWLAMRAVWSAVGE